MSENDSAVVIRQLEATVSSLTEALERGDAERRNLMSALRALSDQVTAAAARQQQLQQQLLAVAQQPLAPPPRSRPTSRPPSPQPPARSITPEGRASSWALRARSTVNADALTPPTESLQLLPHTSSQNLLLEKEGWRFTYKHEPKENITDASLGYVKYLEAEHRAQQHTIEMLQRELKRRDTEYEHNTRLLQKKIAATEASAQQHAHRAHNLEVELLYFKRKHHDATGEHAKVNRGVSFRR